MIHIKFSSLQDKSQIRAKQSKNILSILSHFLLTFALLKQRNLQGESHQRFAQDSRTKGANLIFFIAFLGAITPGPDILLVLRTALKHGFWASFRTLCGIATGWLIYLAVLYFGFAHILKGDLAQMILGFFGGAYLCYLAFLLFRAKPNNIDFNDSGADLGESQQDSRESSADLKQDSLQKSRTGGYLKGLIINLSNPKAIIFFSVIVAPYMDKSTLLNLLLLFAGLNSAFLSVMIVASFSRHLITNKLFDIIDKLCAVVFAGFGIALFVMAFQKATL